MSKDETAVKDEVVQDTTVADPATAEEQELDVDLGDVDVDAYDADDEHAPAEVETEGNKENVADDTAETPADGTKAEDKPQKGYEQRKEQLTGEIEQLKQETGLDPTTDIRELVAQRNMLRELNEARQREGQIATEQELLNQVNPETGDYYSVQDAERIARAQALEQAQSAAAQERQALEIRQSQVYLDSQASKALTDFPMFNPDSPDYKAEVAVRAAQVLDKSLIRDNQGEIIGSYLDPYEYLSTVDAAYKASSVEGQIKGQKATEQMLANADITTSASQTKSKTADDELFEGYDQAI